MEILSESRNCKICLMELIKEDSKGTHLKFTEDLSRDLFDFLLGIKNQTPMLEYGNAYRMVCADCEDDICVALEEKTNAAQPNRFIKEIDLGDIILIKDNLIYDQEKEANDCQNTRLQYSQSEMGKQYGCVICMSKFTLKNNLIRHLRRHFNIKCIKSNPYIKTLNRPRIIRAPLLLRCKECPKVFRGKEAVEAHIAEVHAKPVATVTISEIEEACREVSRVGSPSLSNGSSDDYMPRRGRPPKPVVELLDPTELANLPPEVYKYRRFRNSNNTSSRRSRQNRRIKERLLQEELKILDRKNRDLQAEEHKLQLEYKKWKSILDFLA